MSNQLENNLLSNIILEACVETYDQAILAEKKGAKRIELCGDLLIGGVTPDVDLTKRLLAALTIPIRVMIRPRGGNFVYSEDELRVMKRSILQFKKLKVEGLVFGSLEANKTINVPQTEELARLAKPLKVTFHKAIDDTPNIFLALEKLTKIQGIDTILTSGGKDTAWEGKTVLRKMIDQAQHQLTILSAGRITAQNLAKVHQEIGGTAYHGRKIVGDLFYLRSSFKELTLKSIKQS